MYSCAVFRAAARTVALYIIIHFYKKFVNIRSQKRKEKEGRFCKNAPLSEKCSSIVRRRQSSLSPEYALKQPDDRADRNIEPPDREDNGRQNDTDDSAPTASENRTENPSDAAYQNKHKIQNQAHDEDQDDLFRLKIPAQDRLNAVYEITRYGDDP